MKMEKAVLLSDNLFFNDYVKPCKQMLSIKILSIVYVLVVVGCSFSLSMSVGPTETLKHVKKLRFTFQDFQEI